MELYLFDIIKFYFLAGVVLRIQKKDFFIATF